MSPIEKISDPVADYLDYYRLKMREYLAEETNLISAVTQHIFSSTGKMIRPITLFLSASALGCSDKNMVEPAIALELIHTATLMHDDVIDQSNFRRGIETVNYQWSNLVAVLMGDYFFAKALRILVNTKQQSLLEAVSTATERVSVGELAQVQELNNTSLTEQEYMAIISDKTASLFSCAGQCGGIVAGTNGEILMSLYEYGENLGIAFQITDDLLDFVGEEEKLGKGTGNDLKEGWFTLPLLYSLNNCTPAAGKEIRDILNNGFREEQFDKILLFVNESGGIEYSRKRAENFRNKALDALEGIEDSIFKDALINLTDFTVTREK